MAPPVNINLENEYWDYDEAAKDINDLVKSGQFDVIVLEGLNSLYLEILELLGPEKQQFDIKIHLIADQKTREFIYKQGFPTRSHVQRMEDYLKRYVQKYPAESIDYDLVIDNSLRNADIKPPSVGHVEPVVDADTALQAGRHDEAYNLVMEGLLGEDYVVNIETAIGVLKALMAHYGADTPKGNEIKGVLAVVTKHEKATDQSEMRAELRGAMFSTSKSGSTGMLRTEIESYLDEAELLLGQDPDLDMLEGAIHTLLTNALGKVFSLEAEEKGASQKYRPRLSSLMSEMNRQRREKGARPPGAEGVSATDETVASQAASGGEEGFL